jgi:transposase
VVRHRLSLGGNRKKLAEGKSSKEALRCLKRRISDAVFRSLQADSRAPSSSAA